jgi:hypothetical protein
MSLAPGRKANIQQVFIYILAALVIGFIMLIGIKSFINIDKGKCQAESITFRRELATALDRNDVWGREEKVAITKPCDYDAICFVDARTIKQASAPGGPGEYAALEMGNRLTSGALHYTLDGDQKSTIQMSVNAGIEKNIFIIKKKLVEPIDYDEKIVLDDTCDAGTESCPIFRDTIDSIEVNIPKYVFCVPAHAGKFSFTLSGQGKTVMVGP